MPASNLPATPPEYDAMWLEIRAMCDARSGEGAAIALNARLLEAESAADVLAMGTPDAVGLVRTSHLLGRPIYLWGVEGFNESSYDAGAPYYAVCKFTDLETGENDICEIGGLTPVTQVYRLMQLDAFPIAVVLSESEKETKSGFHPRSLRALSPREQEAYKHAIPLTVA